MEIEENTKTVQDYVQILRRRKYTILVLMSVLLVISLTITLALPPIYRSTATILIEQPKVPADLVKSTVMSPPDERIKQIEQTIMTVTKINEIIDEYHLYPTKKANASELAEKFRAAYIFEIINVDVLGKLGMKGSKITLSFTITFEHKDARLAQKTASKITNLFLAENAKSRAESARQASRFLEAEAEKARLEILQAETQVAEYKNKYNDSLPEMLSSHLADMERIEDQIQQMTLQEQVINEQKNTLQIQLAATSPVPLDTTGKTELPEDLPTLKVKYARLLMKYSVLHPDVVALKHKIDNYKEPERLQIIPTNPVYLQLKGQLDMANVQQQNLMKQRQNLHEQLKSIQQKIAQTPQVERQYASLMRDLESNRLQYKELKEKYLEAKLSQSLEDEQQSERFTVTEPPSVPSKPEKPDRLKLLLAGIGASIVGSIVIAFAIDLLGGGVRGYNSVTFFTQMPPLVVVPYIQNNNDKAIERKKRNRFILLCFFLIILTLVIIHVLYMPMGDVTNLIMNKTLSLIGT